MHPELPSCADCQKWMYDPKERWQRTERPKGTPTLRPAGSTLPCWQCPKVPKSADPSPANAIEMTDQSWAIYNHYLRCRAVGRWPNDPIVERHAAIIRAVEDMAQQAQGMDQLLTLAQIMIPVTGRRK